MKIAILVLAHKPIKYFENLASNNPQICFFVHMDKKVEILDPKINNLKFLPNELRVNVKWGGFSG